jgi:predicted ATPase
LATSREALGVDGEVLRPVGPLDLPDDGAPSAELVAAASVQLFADRALSVRPDFALDAQNASVVADICRQLDGVPLAIELAAARVSSMTVDEIGRRLDQRFRLLTGGRRTALERHQTLRAAVDWSYDLLEEVEARAFDRLAVFVGGVTLAAAEVVVSGEGIESDDVLDALSRLVARSMVVADDSAGMTRYRLLETMRQYARERLDVTDESDLIRRRHAEYYVLLAADVDVGLKGRDEERWLRTMDAEFANFRTAFDWSVGIGDVDLALRLTVALGRFGVPRPRYSVWRWIELVSEMPQARDHPLRPQAMAFGAVDVVVASGGPGLLADRVRKMDAAFAHADLELTSYAVWAHSALAAVTGRPEEAIEQGARAVELALAGGDLHAASVHGSMLSLFLTTYGDTDRAVQRAQEAFALGSELGNPTLLAVSEVSLGSALKTVDPQRARVHLQAGVSRSRLVGNDMARSIGERKLAELLAAAGDLIGALETYLDVLEHATEFGVRLPVAMTCRSIAIDLATAGYDEIAATMFGALESRLDVDHGEPLMQREATVERLHRAIGTKFDERAARGREMDDEAFAAFVSAQLARIIAELEHG